jgi:hypothetical protein
MALLTASTTFGVKIVFGTYDQRQALCAVHAQRKPYSSRNWAFAAQALAAQFDAVGVVDDTIEDGVSQGGIAHEFVPALDRKLAGDDQRAGVVAVLDDLQQVALLLGQQRFGSPIIEDEEIDAAELAYQLGVATVTTSQCQQGKQPWDALVEDREILTARLVAKGASQPRLADTAWASEILPKISSSTFRSTIRIILASVSVSQLCDPFSTADIYISL